MTDNSLRRDGIVTKSAVVFLHISKTGGTTLRSIIQKQYSADEIYDLDPSYFTSDPRHYQQVYGERIRTLSKMGDKEKENYRCFLHPMGYGIHKLIPQTAQYFTMLRDPLDHYISNFYFALNNPEHINHQYIVENNITIDTFHKHFKIDNMQTRRLSGYDTIDAFYNVAPLPENAIDMAKQNLMEMAVVGLTEEFDISLLMMQRAFSWDDVRYIARNTAPKRIKLNNLNPQTREILQHLLVSDIELYNYALQLFEQQKQNYEITDESVKSFRAANDHYIRQMRLKRRISKLIPPIILKAIKRN